MIGGRANGMPSPCGLKPPARTQTRRRGNPLPPPAPLSPKRVLSTVQIYTRMAQSMGGTSGAHAEASPGGVWAGPTAPMPQGPQAGTPPLRPQHLRPGEPQRGTTEGTQTHTPRHRLNPLGQRGGMHWEGRYAHSPIQGAQSMPSHCPRDGKCQPQSHLWPTVTASSNGLPHRSWGRL